MPVEHDLNSSFLQSNRSSEADSRGELLASGAQRNLSEHCSQAVWSEATKKMTTPAVFPESPSSAGNIRSKVHQPKLMLQPDYCAAAMTATGDA
jgi:hypothetical protein